MKERKKLSLITRSIYQFSLKKKNIKIPNNNNTNYKLL